MDFSRLFNRLDNNNKLNKQTTIIEPSFDSLIRYNLRATKELTRVEASNSFQFHIILYYIILYKVCRENESLI